MPPMSRSLPFLALLVLSAACASSGQQSPAGSTPAPSPAAQPAAQPAAPPATPQPAALNPVGVYDFSTSVQGTEVTGTVTITGADGRYGGSVVTSATPEAPIKSVSVAGQTITVVIPAPDGNDGVLEMKLDGAAFTGSWSYGGQGGSLSGRRR